MGVRRHRLDSVPRLLVGHVQDLHPVVVDDDQLDAPEPVCVFGCVLRKAGGLGRASSREMRCGSRRSTTSPLLCLRTIRKSGYRGFHSPLISYGTASDQGFLSGLRSQPTTSLFSVSCLMTEVSQLLNFAGNLPLSSRYRCLSQVAAIGAEARCAPSVRGPSRFTASRSSAVATASVRNTSCHSSSSGPCSRVAHFSCSTCKAAVIRSLACRSRP